MGKGNSIHSSVQMEYFKATVNDKSIKVGGNQHIITNNDYVLLLLIKNSLPYMNIKSYTNYKWNSLPHIGLTSDAESFSFR